MTQDPHKISFIVGNNSYNISLHLPAATSNKQAPGALGKKYNLLIRKEDLILLDQIQPEIGDSRTSIMNDLMEAVMTRFLMSFDDMTARIALAERVDEKSGVSGHNENWVSTALKPDTTQIIRNYKEHNTPYDPGPDPNYPDYREPKSDEYKSVISKLEKY